MRQRGSQIVVEGPEGKFTVVPRHGEIAPSTLIKTLAEAELTREQFLELL